MQQVLSFPQDAAITSGASALLRKFWREVQLTVFGVDTRNFITLVEGLYGQDCYRSLKTGNGMLAVSGFCWITSRQRCYANHYADVVGIDSAALTNKARWPLVCFVGN